jgi:tRNA G10  N-methylase Trm11
MSSICILGRQPALGLAELESSCGAAAVRPLSHGIAELDADPDFNHFGSILKAATPLTTLPSTEWNKAMRALQSNLPEWLNGMPTGKVTLGISVYGLKATPQQINAGALSLKKVIKAAGRSARVVPNVEPELNTAQVIHNRLAGPAGLELLLIEYEGTIVVARTHWVQDIEAYRRRDQERPMRDARVGMLPPKLAQIIINLSGAQPYSALWDPFCGTGVLLQEALLMDIDAYGTDLEPRMIEYSQKNLEWLAGRSNSTISTRYELQVADATSVMLKSKPAAPVQAIASETYLGRALSSLPDQETLQKIIRDCDTIHTKFLRNAARQTSSGFQLCLAVPAWRTKNGFKHLPTLDHLEELGYNRISFVHAETSDLIYHRADQIVARELVVLTRI